MLLIQNQLRWAVACVLSCAGALSLMGTAAANDQEVLQSLADHVEQLDEVKAESKRAANQMLSDDSLDPVDRLTGALGHLYPAYADAISVSDQGSVDEAVDQLMPLVDQDDPFLAADSSFYLARTLMNDERFESSLPLLEKLTDELSKVSLHRDVVSYYIGIAQAGVLKNKEAQTSLAGFLEGYPDAPERLRVSAWRKMQELQAIEAGKLDDVYQRMDFSRRRLEHIETDEATQEQQDKIVKLLNKMIQQEEKKEATSSSKSNKKNQQKNQQEPQAQNKPQQGKPSKSNKPGSSSNANGKVVDKSYDDSPASPWSRLRDRSRDPANTAVKDKLPARYRDIVEKYYEAANGNSDTSGGSDNSRNSGRSE